MFPFGRNTPLHASQCTKIGLCHGGTGTSFDGGGVGTNQPDTDVWKVYSANGTHGPAPSAPHQQVMSSESNTAERSLHAVVGTIVN